MLILFVRLDLIILPLLTLGFFCLQLDRGNIANAITDSFREDINITQDQFNVGQQMLSLGIVLFEIPSNMILYRVGPGKWLTLQLFLFGTVSTFQAWQNDYGSFIASRLLLGITESGFIPGGLVSNDSNHRNFLWARCLTEILPATAPRLKEDMRERGSLVQRNLLTFDQSRLVDIVNLVHSQGNSQTSHDLLLWQPIWPGFRKAFGVWYITHAWCRRQTWVVLALRSHGGFHHSVRFRARFPPTRLVRKPSQRFPSQMAHLLRA